VKRNPSKSAARCYGYWRTVGRTLRLGVVGLFGMGVMGFGYRLYPSYRASNPPQAEFVRLNMPLTFPGMGFGLGCMVEGCALFGMADCRYRSESALRKLDLHGKWVGWRK
jgi:hypothetical protein